MAPLLFPPSPFAGTAHRGEELLEAQGALETAEAARAAARAHQGARVALDTAALALAREREAVRVAESRAVMASNGAGFVGTDARPAVGHAKARRKLLEDRAASHPKWSEAACNPMGETTQRAHTSTACACVHWKSRCASTRPPLLPGLGTRHAAVR